MSTFGLERVFAPERIAIVGGSPRPSWLGALVLRNSIGAGFAGDVAVDSDSGLRSVRK
jgi:acetyltransferase